MIDFNLRNKRILQEAADGETAVILLDLVLATAHTRPGARDRAVLKQAQDIARRAGRHLVLATS